MKQNTTLSLMRLVLNWPFNRWPAFFALARATSNTEWSLQLAYYYHTGSGRGTRGRLDFVQRNIVTLNSDGKGIFSKYHKNRPGNFFHFSIFFFRFQVIFFPKHISVFLVFSFFS